MKFDLVSLPRLPEARVRILTDNSGKRVIAQVEERKSIIGTLVYNFPDTNYYRIFEENGQNSEYRIDDLISLSVLRK